MEFEQAGGAMRGRAGPRHKTDSATSILAKHSDTLTVMARLSTQQEKELPDSAFAFPRERKEPLVDASHVRNAAARFNQVEGVSKAEREEANKRIERAAEKFDVDLSKEPD
jgi:hypothetical protein